MEPEKSPQEVSETLIKINRSLDNVDEILSQIEDEQSLDKLDNSLISL